MAHQSSVDTELADMMECSVCTEVFTDPRILPCHHTFCLNCLLNCGQDRQPGDQMNCPRCREQFLIPRGGLSEMKKNFKMGKWLYVQKTFSRKSHVWTAENILISSPLRCSHECRVAVCVTCFIKSHKTHDCSDIEQVSDVLGDTQKVSELWKITEDVLEHLEKEKNDAIKHLAGIEDEINTAADKLIAAIQRDREKLLSVVKSIILKWVNQVEMVKQEVEQYKAVLASFMRDSETVLNSRLNSRLSSPSTDSLSLYVKWLIPGRRLVNHLWADSNLSINPHWVGDQTLEAYSKTGHTYVTKARLSRLCEALSL